MKSKGEILHEIIEPGDIRKYLTNNIKYIKKDTILFEQDNEPLGIYYLLKGSVKISKVCKKEKERILKVALDGDIFGVEAFIKGIKNTSTASVLEDSIVCFVSTSELSDLIKQYPYICFELLVKLHKFLLAAEKRIYLISIKTVEEKLAEIMSEQNISALNSLHSDFTLHENIHIENKIQHPKAIKHVQKANYFQLKIKQLIC